LQRSGSDLVSISSPQIPELKAILNYGIFQESLIDEHGVVWRRLLVRLSGKLSEAGRITNVTIRDGIGNQRRI
jgi:hypothetical protein